MSKRGVGTPVALEDLCQAAIKEFREWLEQNPEYDRSEEELTPRESDRKVDVAGDIIEALVRPLTREQAMGILFANPELYDISLGDNGQYYGDTLGAELISAIDQQIHSVLNEWLDTRD